MRIYYELILLFAVRLLRNSVAVFFIVFYAHSSFALDVVEIESVTYGDFARIIFRSDADPSDFDVQINSGTLSITLGSPSSVNFGKLLVELSDQLDSASLSEDSTTVFLKLKNPDIKIRKFIGDHFAGVDLVFSSTEKPLQTVEQENIVNDITLHSKPDFSVKKKIELPVYGPDIPPTHKTTVKKIQKDIKKVAVKKRKNILQVERSRLTNGIKLIFPWEKNVASAIFTRNQYVWVVFNSKSRLDLSTIKGIQYISSIKQLSSNDFVILRIKIDDKYRTKDYSKYVSDASAVPLLNISSYKDITKWVLVIQEDNAEENAGVANPITVLSGANSGTPRIFLSLKKANFLISKSLKIIDTEVGDTIIIFPLYENEMAVVPKRTFVDFELLRTVQGIAIKKISSALKYKAIDNGKSRGVEITSSNNLNISAELYNETDDNLLSQQAVNARRIKKKVLPSETVFPFQKDIDEEISFTNKKRELYEKLIYATEEDKADRRLDIANFLFSRDLFAEAFGVLREIKIRNPLYKSMQEVDIDIAACHYMLHHYRRAEEEFRKLALESLELESYDELKLWEWASIRQQHRSGKKADAVEIPVDYIASYDQFMQKYPDRIRYSFGLLAIRERLLKGDIDTGRTILEIISYDKIPKMYENHTDYLRAKISNINGDTEDAVKIWTELSEQYDDRYNRARAMFSLTTSKLIHGEITVDDAIETLNKVDILWRGDDFELKLLQLIGQLYVKEKRYHEGLREWHTLVSSFPNTKEAVFVAGKMKKTFIKLFDKGEAYNLPPFKALSLYFEFRELTPVGKRGDRIIRQLADHFIKADLLENAAALIEHQVKFRSVGEEKNTLAIKLSNLHLKNNNPIKALDALKFIVPESIGPKLPEPDIIGPKLPEKDKPLTYEEVKKEAVYLTARANLALEEYEKALAVLGKDLSKEAQDIRLDAYWNRKNWFELIDIIESRLDGLKKNAPEPLKTSQIKDIIRLALAYGTLEYRDKLRSLQSDFINRIDEASSENIFQFITHDIKSVDYKAFEKTVQLNDIESFVNEYAFWPGKDWKNIVNVLAPRVKKITDAKQPLTQKEKNDVVRLAIAYSMQKEDKEAQKQIGRLGRDFRSITINKDTLKIFRIFDDKFVPKENDAEFEGNISLTKTPSFIEKYQAATSISELNAAIE